MDIARDMLRKELLFPEKYYQVLESDFTTFDGFQHSKELGAPTKAPDWSDDPAVECGQGLYFVSHHPFLASMFVNRKNPRFFEIEKPEGFLESPGSWCKFRAERLVKKREITRNSLEASREALLEFGVFGRHRWIRKAVASMYEYPLDQDLILSALWDVCPEVALVALSKIPTDKEMGPIAERSERSAGLFADLEIALFHRLDPSEHEKVFQLVLQRLGDKDFGHNKGPARLRAFLRLSLS